MKTISIEYIQLDTQHIFLIHINGVKHAEYYRNTYQEAHTIAAQTVYNYLKVQKQKSWE